ncbi:MAG: hypothetical protein HRT43_08380 [Campylobacteraceae bacterium]|nr:hypothetical protein [Campylobacteraceae bacterium]
MAYIASVLLILVGFGIIVSDQWHFRGQKMNLSEYNLDILFGSGLIIYGLLLIYSTKNPNKNKKIIEHTKCPKCKETYTYIYLKEGICPKCHIKTIEIEEYFKQYPKELENV